MGKSTYAMGGLCDGEGGQIFAILMRAYHLNDPQRYDFGVIRFINLFRGNEGCVKPF